MGAAANNDMIVDRDAQQSTGFCDLMGNMNVGSARFGIAAWMVMDKYERAGTNVECAADHFAWMNCGFVDRTFRSKMVINETVARV
tara:strand:+ start:663 stop:920 length:258 start_codon:yes stop_codon:yes gene_type:complete